MKRIISAINAQPVDFGAGSPIGTLVARVTVSVSSGSFTGTLTPAAAVLPLQIKSVKNVDGSFNLLTTIVVPVGWSPSINLIATQSAFANSPLWAGPFIFAPTVQLAIALSYAFLPYPGQLLGAFPKDAPAGTVVANFTAIRNDAQPFTGHMDFVTINGVVQNFNGAYKITMNANHTATMVLVDPTKLDGMLPSTKHVQVVAYP